MLPLLRTAVGALATVRLTKLVIEDYITADLRDLVLPKLSPKLQYLAQCPWCISVWLGTAVAGAVIAATPEARPTRTTALVSTTLLGLAYSQLTGMLAGLED